MQVEASPKTDAQPEQQTGPESSHSPLLSPGRNCWRIEHTQRFKLLIDADAYFSAVRAAIAQAQDSVFILGWDIDSRTVLTPAGAEDHFPAPLGEFLHAVVAARPHLHIHILNWDFAMLYALEREWLPVYRLGWRKQRRLSYLMDARHPVGASHHQKVVVIDNRLAFVGGLDLTRCRWDTQEHAAEHPLRYDPLGTPYPPFHDVQAMLDGDAAAALGELARIRWERAGGKPLKSPKQSNPSRSASKKESASDHARDIWPAACEPDLTDFNIAIARTEPAHLGRSGVYEIRQLYLDAIAHARHSLFFENQYFTANVLSDALSARLNDEDAPEIVVISPQLQSGWLEQATMGDLRARIHQGLKAADRHGRYRMYCPHLPDLNDACLNVHSKIFAVDDDLFCVGSANMSNRSMSFDTECNLVIETQGGEAQQARMRTAIAAMRNRLLAEHLHVAADTVADAIAQYGGLHAAVTTLQTEGRTLLPLDPAPIFAFDELAPELAVFDPERPIDADELVAQFVPEEVRKPAPRRLIGLGALAVVLTITALAWRFTPLHEWINLASLVALARSLDQQALPFAPLIVILAFVVAGTFMVPVILLIAVSGVAFGPFYGALYAIAGTMLTAAAGFALGVWLGRDTLRQLLGHRVNRLSERFARRGIMSMTVLRLLPVAPFAVVNVVAGASHLLLRDYLIGTMLGMFPGILLTVVFSHNLAEAVRHPNLATMTVVALLAILLIGLAFGLHRLLTPRQPSRSHESSETDEGGR
jgi:phospholipase D1/2